MNFVIILRCNITLGGYNYGRLIICLIVVRIVLHYKIFFVCLSYITYPCPMPMQHSNCISLQFICVGAYFTMIFFHQVKCGNLIVTCNHRAAQNLCWKGDARKPSFSVEV